MEDLGVLGVAEDDLLRDGSMLHHSFKRTTRKPTVKTLRPLTFRGNSRLKKYALPKATCTVTSDSADVNNNGSPYNDKNDYGERSKTTATGSTVMPEDLPCCTDTGACSAEIEPQMSQLQVISEVDGNGEHTVLMELTPPIPLDCEITVTTSSSQVCRSERRVIGTLHEFEYDPVMPVAEDMFTPETHVVSDQ